MIDFNALPLAEKIKQAQAGDIVLTDSGAKVPLKQVDIEGCFHLDVSRANAFWIYTSHVADIIRPSERKVPEIGERLRKFACRERRSLGATRMDMNTPVGHLADILADHFEKETP